MRLGPFQGALSPLPRTNSLTPEGAVLEKEEGWVLSMGQGGVRGGPPWSETHLTSPSTGSHNKI